MAGRRWSQAAAAMMLMVLLLTITSSVSERLELRGGEKDGDGKEGKSSGPGEEIPLRADDGDPNVGGAGKGTTCPVKDEESDENHEKVELRGLQESEGKPETTTQTKKSTAEAKKKAAAGEAKLSDSNKKQPEKKQSKGTEAEAKQEDPKKKGVKGEKDSKQKGSTSEQVPSKLEQLKQLNGSIYFLLEEDAASNYSLLSPKRLQVINESLLVYNNDTWFPDTRSFFESIYQNATMHGDAQCQFWLGRMFELGGVMDDGEEVVPKDVNQAAQLYALAAEQGHPEAARMLGTIFEEHGDADRAAQYYMKAVELGDVRSISLLGMMYEQAGSVDEAISLFTQAELARDGLAMASLGRIYLDGKGVPQDGKKAISYLEQAAAEKEIVAWTYLGRAYEQGKGVKQNYSSAFGFYKLAADAGEWNAQARLSFLYSKGLGVERNIEEAERWAMKAAENGYDDTAEIAAEEIKAYENLNGKVLKGGRPSRFEYMPSTPFPLNEEEKRERDAKGFDGLSTVFGRIARFRYTNSTTYLSNPEVFYTEDKAGKLRQTKNPK
eukprot:144101-Hanusia_phi.AAC.3